MKVLLVAHFFPPNHTAGAEKRALGYAEMLQKLGHTVQVVCAGDWDVGKHHLNGFTDEVYRGVAVRRVNLNWMRADDINRSLYDNSLFEEKLLSWLSKWQPDVVHIISLITLGAGVVRAAKKFELPVIFTLTDFWMICPKISLVKGDGVLCDGKTTNWDCLECMLSNSKAYHGLSNVVPDKFSKAILTRASQLVWLNRQRGLRGMALDMADRRRVMAEIAQMVDYVTAPSTYLGRVIDQSSIFPDPVNTIHSGHDLSWLEKMPESQPSEVVRVGYIGQLIPVKGVDILIQAFKLATEKMVARLLIYGDTQKNPEYVVSLQALTQIDDGIQFLGPFNHDHLGQVLSSLDVLVVPSQWHENNPRVIQEAFAGKIPVIASNVGGISEFVEHGVNGLLFDHESAKDLRVQLDRILMEPSLLQHLKDGIKSVKTVTEEMNEIIEVYENLISKKGKEKSLNNFQLK